MLSVIIDFSSMPNWCRRSFFTSTLSRLSIGTEGSIRSLFTLLGDHLPVEGEVWIRSRPLTSFNWFYTWLILSIQRKNKKSCFTLIYCPYFWFMELHKDRRCKFLLYSIWQLIGQAQLCKNVNSTTFVLAGYQYNSQWPLTKITNLQ